MAGIYIHIPFCKRRCSYCDFYKSTLTGLLPEFLNSLNVEISKRKDYLGGEPVNTIYFGGGTPSLMSVSQVEAIISKLRKTFAVADNCEITLEANPDDISSDYLSALFQTGINRLSIGVQSFEDVSLTMLHRRHDALQSIKCIEYARMAGFNNISIDLIYGIPGMKKETWQRNLELALQAEHISAYHLTIEPGTALHRSLSKGLLLLPDESESEIQFNMIDEICEPAGFVHYEISNLARAGFQSKHNSNYWSQKKYLGFGPSAHSFNLDSRQWNQADVKKYIISGQTGVFDFEKEILSETNCYNEHIMLTLRTDRAVDAVYIENTFGKNLYDRFVRAAKPFLQSGHLVKSNAGYSMTRKGWMISDFILAALMMEGV